ncbi:unnamed protein product [Mytilus edulis]|uniref:Endonuclease/exonuclease/phosphatase domain-containing protein n=1 Tax=Mytilus edulis TaxID=6550 RepID=A0A8S3UZ21_MYTED|nr:unnamed protein product [Mytilus edulis]
MIIMAGDFNLQGWDWKPKSLSPNTHHTNIHHKFTDILDDHGLQQMVEEPTKESNTLDLIITNYPNSFIRVETIHGISDHDIVFAELKTIPSKQTQKPRNISLYKKAKGDNIKEDLKSINEEITKMNHQDCCTQGICGTISEQTRKYHKYQPTTENSKIKRRQPLDNSRYQTANSKKGQTLQEKKEIS